MSSRAFYDQLPASLDPISPDLVPTVVAGVLYDKSVLYVRSCGAQPEDFDVLMSAKHTNGVTSYVAQQQKTYANGQTEQVFHVVDAFNDEDYIGYGEIRFAVTDISDYFKDKPFIGMIWTESEYRGQRLGNLFQRLLLMKSVTETQLGLPLYSDTLISRSALRVAHRLVRAGLAEEVYESGLLRFRSTMDS